MKRRISTKKYVQPLDSFFIGLPSEIWCKVILPMISNNELILLLTLSKQWCSLIYQSIKSLLFHGGHYKYMNTTYLEQFKQLEYFRLDNWDKSLNNVIPGLRKLSRLLSISLNNTFGQLNDNQLVSFTNLKQLSLDNNYTVPCNGLVKLTNLEKLSIHNAKNDCDSMDNTLKELVRLTYLDVSFTKISDNAICTLSRLTHLDLSGCSLSLRCLEFLPLLKFLSLPWKHKDTKNNLRHIGGLMNLQDLRLNNTIVKPEILTCLTNLEKLSGILYQDVVKIIPYIPSLSFIRISDFVVVPLQFTGFELISKSFLGAEFRHRDKESIIV